MKTETSNLDKTLIENLIKELFKQNILINRKATQGLELEAELKAELYELKLSQMDKICEVRNRISDIKVKKDDHSGQGKDNKRLCDEHESQNTIIKLLIDNFKQLADSIGKSNTTVPLLQTLNFPEHNNFILPKKHALE